MEFTQKMSLELNFNCLMNGSWTFNFGEASQSNSNYFFWLDHRHLLTFIPIKDKNKAQIQVFSRFECHFCVILCEQVLVVFSSFLN